MCNCNFKPKSRSKKHLRWNKWLNIWQLVATIAPWSQQQLAHVITVIVNKAGGGEKQRRKDRNKATQQKRIPTKLEESTLRSARLREGLADHAQEDGSSARLGVVELHRTSGVDVLLLGEDLGSACSAGPPPTTATLYFMLRREDTINCLSYRGEPGETRGAEDRDTKQ
jgi:hypothetical protein